MKYLYTSPLPEATQPTEQNSLGNELAELGLLEGDGAIVESVSGEAADLSLEGQYNWGEGLAQLVAAELDELSASALTTLPLYRREGRDPQQGYYEIASADVEPLHANERSIWQYSLSLTFVGTRASHYREVSTKRSQLDHPFGNDLDAIVAIPAAAEKVRWFDAASGARASADAVETVATAGVDLERYDVDAGESALDGADRPELVYDVDYDTDRRAGCRVYDTRGDEDKTDDDGVRHWRLIHDPRHDIDDPVVLSSGRIRLRAAEGENTLEAAEWDDSDGSWSDVALDESDWELFEVDLRSVGAARVTALLEFRDPSASPTGYYTLRAIVRRGADAVQFDREGLESTAVPSGLEDLLDPVAAPSIVGPGERQDLQRRSEVKG
ncbi:MAG: hypothetical protein ACOCS7_02130 [Halolamina sp.]